MIPRVEVSAEQNAGEEEKDVVKAERELIGEGRGSTHLDLTLPGTNNNEGANDSEELKLPGMFTLSEKTKQIMQDEARHLGFWDWLEKFGSLPFPVLFEIFDYTLVNRMDC